MNDRLPAWQTAFLAGRGPDLLALAALLALGSFAFFRVMSLPAFEDEGSQLRLI
jgi:hypothetical protein